MTKDTDGIERRRFPRVQVQCALLWKRPEMDYGEGGVLMDYSATGLRMRCDEPLLPDTSLHVEIPSCSHRMVPAIEADAMVVRCEPTLDGDYLIACRMTRISPLKPDNAAH